MSAMKKSNKTKIIIWSSVLGIIFLLAVICLSFSKMIKVPSSYANLLSELQNQTQYKLISLDKKDGSDNIQVYNMEFEKGINVDFYICQSKKDAKRKYEELTCHSIVTTITVMDNSRRIFKRDNKYIQVFKYHNKNGEDFVVNVYSNNKNVMGQFIKYYFALCEV